MNNKPLALCILFLPFKNTINSCYLFSPFAMSVVHFTQDSKIIVSCFIVLLEKHCLSFSLFIQFVGSKEKGRISKRVFQENKAKFSDKRIFLTIWYRCEGVRNFRFPEKLTCFAFLLPPFWDSPFCLIIDELSRCKLQENNIFFHITVERYRQHCFRLYFYLHRQFSFTTGFINNFMQVMLQVFEVLRSRRWYCILVYT